MLAMYLGLFKHLLLFAKLFTYDFRHFRDFRFTFLCVIVSRVFILPGASFFVFFNSFSPVSSLLPPFALFQAFLL